MVFSRIRSAFRKEIYPPGSLPAEVRVYAVGDVHGRLDLLIHMQKLIADDLRAAPSPQVLTVFLGDLIDRGPDSRRVVDHLLSGLFPTAITVLRGNHEQQLLAAVEDRNALAAWCGIGGLETLHSYGVDITGLLRGIGFEAAHEKFKLALPEAHLRFYESTQPSFAAGDYFLCHAGVRPRVALEDQKFEDLMWIRDEFLRFQGSFGKIIVHGHTPVERPDVRLNRINIDTGAFATSVLSALVLEGSSRRFLSTGQ